VVLSPPHPREWLYTRTRRRLGARVLRGEGIEIGALHSPFPAPARARVRYVDRLTTAQLRAEYPELGDDAMVEVDAIDDGETLATFAGASLDFVIASHMLEHTEEPIGALQAQLRVLRPGGVVLIALPDRRDGLDIHRDATTLEHLLADHEHGPQRSRAQHYRDWATQVDLPLGNISADEVDEHAAELEGRLYRIHYHCWTGDEFALQLGELITRGLLSATLQQWRQNYHEFLVVLERTG
jgi:SAM-dependent methyltransferase